MQKIIKLSQNLENLHSFRFISRFQFKVEKPIYYPRRDLSEDDVLTPTPRSAIIPTLDYYKVLGLQRDASTQEIKTAYYELAKKHHPDAKPTSQKAKTFQKISEAYRILSDEYSRLEYDKNGIVQNVLALSNGQEPRSRKFGSLKSKPVYPMVPTFNEVPDTTEKRIALKDRPRTSATTEVQLEVRFLDAIRGGKEFVDLKAMIKCPKCNGASKLGRQVNVEFCQKCGGTGQYRDRKSLDPEVKKCDCCDGKRYVTHNSCETCDNRGIVVESRRVELFVPSGSNDGDIISIINPVNGQKVKVILKVDKSNYFRREGNNIYTDKYITISQAVLGGNFKIRGLYEDHEVSLGPGIESHTTHCFSGKGINTNTSAPGDHYVIFKIRIPKSLTTKQRQLILALSRTEDPTFDGQK